MSTGLNIELIKARLNQLQSANKRSSTTWKPKPGKTIIRILPSKFNPETPFIEMYFHYGLLNNRSYLSPISFGRPDPIEEFADKLKTAGSKTEWELGKKLEAKMRTFAPVIVRDEEDQNVRFWGFGKQVYEELLSSMADPDYGNIIDPHNGRDITVEFKTAKELDAMYPKTTVRVKPIQSAISDDRALLDKWLDEQPEITELYPELSYDELAEVLEKYLNPTEEPDGTTTAVESSSPVTQEELKASAASVDNFDEIFKDD